MSIECVMVHGWGFNSRVWAPLCERLTRIGVVINCIDRGYFNPATGDAWHRPYAVAKGQTGTGHSNPGVPTVVIVHSLGLHLAPPPLLAQADLIIGLSTFLSFHPSEPLACRRSRRTIKAMIARFKQAPHAVLRDFYAHCGVPNYPVPPSLNTDLLVEDLRLLDEAAMPPEVLAERRILLFHGCADPIVPHSSAEMLSQAVPDSTLHTLQGAAHALPLTHAEQIVHAASPMMETLISGNTHVFSATCS